MTLQNKTQDTKVSETTHEPAHKSPLADSLLFNVNEQVNYDEFKDKLGLTLDEVVEQNGWEMVFNHFGSCAIVTNDTVFALSIDGFNEKNFVSTGMRDDIIETLKTKETAGRLAGMETLKDVALSSVYDVRVAASIMSVLCRLTWLDIDRTVAALAAQGFLQFGGERESTLTKYHAESGILVRIAPSTVPGVPVSKIVTDIDSGEVAYFGPMFEKSHTDETKAKESVQPNKDASVSNEDYEEISKWFL